MKSEQEVAVWYNDNVIYPDKVRLNCHYYRHYLAKTEQTVTAKTAMLLQF